MIRLFFHLLFCVFMAATNAYAQNVSVVPPLQAQASPPLSLSLRSLPQPMSTPWQHFQPPLTWSYVPVLRPRLPSDHQTQARHSILRNTIWGIANSIAEFKLLSTAIRAAGMNQILDAEGPLTVFVPSEEAISALPQPVLNDMIFNPLKLSDILGYHIVPGRIMAEDLSYIRSVKNLDGGILLLSDDDGFKVNGLKVLTADIRASNGVIHVIEGVLVPPPSIRN